MIRQGLAVLPLDEAAKALNLPPNHRVIAAEVRNSSVFFTVEGPRCPLVYQRDQHMQAMWDDLGPILSAIR